MVYFTREISQKLIDASKTFPCLVLTGARQVGKSTLLKQLFPNHQYLTLDLPSDADQANNDPTSFFKRFKQDVIIDEVQYAPGIFRNLKTLIDEDRHRMGRFILTGSQKFTLMKEVSDSLAGRVAILNLENLSINELPQQSDWIKILHKGLYPELWRNPELSTNLFYSSYVATYLERDIRQVINVNSLRDFERFIRSCAARSGQLLNMSDLGRDVGIKAHTARDWLSVLEATNQITLLEPYFENVGKRIVKSPKLYLNDPGMLCFLLGFQEETLLSTPIIGIIWETYVLSELRKRASNYDKQRTLWFYRDEQGKEIDFIETTNGSLNLYEVKWSDSDSRRWISNLMEVQNYLGRSRISKLGHSKLITRTTTKRVEDEVTILNPIHEFS